MSRGCWFSRQPRRSISPTPQRICGEIRSAIAAKRPPVKLLVIEASGIIDIDYTGSQIAAAGNC